MMGSITILPGSGDPNALAPNTLPTNALAPNSRGGGPGGSADAATNAPSTPPFTLTPVDYDPYALTPSGLVDVTQPFGLNDPARFDASAPGWTPFRSTTPAPSLASPTPAPGSAGVASGEDSTFAPGWDSGSAPGSFSGLAPNWGSTAAPPSPSQPPSLATGVGDTMDQVEGGGPAAAGNTDFFGRPLDGGGLDDFKQVGRDVLDKAANGMLVGFAPRLGAAVDYAVRRAPTYDAALASRNADQAQADADMGPLAPIVEMAGGALLPWGLLSDGLEGLTLGRRLLADTGIGGGMGAIYGVGASPDLTNLAQTLHAMARSAAMGGVLGMGLPYVVPLAAGLAGAAGHTAAGGADAFSGFGTTLFDYGAQADGAPGGAYTGRRYDPETGLTHDRARAYSPSLGRFLQADPIGTQGNVSRYDYLRNDPANLIDPLGTASLSTSTSGSISGLAQSPGDGGATFIPVAEKTPEDPEQQKEHDTQRIAGFVTPSQPSDNLIIYPAPSQGLYAAESGALGTAEAEAKGGTYSLRDPETGDVVRTGRTNNLARREAEHARDPTLGDYNFEDVYRTDNYSMQRGLEQYLHDQYSPPLNKINPISPSNPKITIYQDAAKQYLLERGGP